MEEKLKSNRVLQININKNDKVYDIIDKLSFKSKNIYNYANYIIRQVFITTGSLRDNKEITKEQQDFLLWINENVDKYNENKRINLEIKKSKGKSLDIKHKPLEHFDINHRSCSYDFIDYITKYSEAFTDLGSGSSQATLRVLDKNWKSFYASIKDWVKNPSKYLGRPKLPKYKSKENGRFPLYVSNIQVHIKEDHLYFSWNPLKELNNRFKLPIKGKLMQVRFILKNNKYIMEIVYEINIPKTNENQNRIIGIDIGLNNLTTVVNNIELKPFVLNGRPLKSMNQYYNKEKARIQSELKIVNKNDWSNKLQRLTDKRNNKIKDYIHKSSKYIINWCIENNIDTIIIGKNKGWKQECDMGKRNNQGFIQIPFDTLIKQIVYKAENIGIKVITNEESYTSGTSFLDGEMPIKENYDKSRRITRGLFKSDKGVIINADVNGAYQIIQKVIPKCFTKGIEGVGLHPIIVDL